MKLATLRKMENWKSAADSCPARRWRFLDKKLGTASGHQKKEAETLAAKEALAKIG